MSILQGAHDVVINGDLHNIEMQHIYQHGSTGIDILREAAAPEATVDAEERSYAPSCYPGTREQYIDDIDKWATAWGSDNTPPIYWMKGPAGVGKSAIAQTCVTILKDEGKLGAAFFFSINGRRKDHTRFFPTLAYQLATILSADCRDYRKIVNRRVSDDQTLVKKTMASQFRSLIVEPLQELREQGKGLQRRAIFIDGLDECESRSAQVEIIQIIASSVRNGSTPFRWAIFSREEPHIVSTFTSPSISSHCHIVFLPISREADEEIELYLRGGFQNILQRRNLLSLSSSWPTVGDIKTLVDAAAGLFAHSATVLRFIDCHSYSGFQESLGDVIASITNPGSKSLSLYAELDRLYTLILQRVPADTFPSMFRLLSDMGQYGIFGRGWNIAAICNCLGISEAVFRSIYHHLQAVLIVQDPPQLTIDKAIALERSYYDQDLAFNPIVSLQLFKAHGTVHFHHKSFYDFIIDRDRSSTFCVTTPAAREQLAAHLVQQHFHFASSYAVQGPKLILAPGIASSSASLSWPQGTEFADSFLQLWSFSTVSFSFSHDNPHFCRFLHDVPSSSLHRLAELDYRKALIGFKMDYGLGLQNRTHVIGYGCGTTRYTDDSMFMCINKDNYDVFNPAAFLRMVDRLEKAGVIRPFDPRLGASRAASLLHAFSRQKPHGRSYGQYKMGRGDKSMIWYWEFDTEKRYFHEFQTTNFAQAMAYYKAKKFNIWNGEEDSAGDEDGVVTDNDDETKDEGDGEARDGEGNIARGNEAD